MFYLPDKKECDNIVENSKQFFRKDTEFLNKHLAIYHYKQGKYEEFEKFNAWELRSLTFVKNKKWDRFLGIHKFFELNAAPGWREEDLKQKKIIKVQEKIDGTLMQPIPINGDIYFKSKLTFDSIQAKRANEILKNDKKTQEFIFECFKNGKIPLFEYISPQSQIVMDYNKEALILIQIRDLRSGKYDLSFEEQAKKFDIECAKVYKPAPLEKFIKQSESRHDLEGWVIIFEDMRFVKLKTKTYLYRHEILGDIKENDIIQLTLNGQIDGVLALLNKQSDKYHFVSEIKEKFLQKYNSLQYEINSIIKNFKGSTKEFKQKFANYPYYALLSEAYKKRKKIPPRKVIYEWSVKHTKKLKNAKRFLES